MTTTRESQTLRMKALAEARTLILSGVFAPGERISEPLLADRLDVSRTPLREALASLAQEGLVEQQASGRWQVCSYSIQDIMDAIEVRGTLEGLAARFAAERGLQATGWRPVAVSCRTSMTSWACMAPRTLVLCQPERRLSRLDCGIRREPDPASRG